ncbi:MAG: hypothetical protein Tsb0013_22590 [Phycisphaerales bacterium]
MKQSVQIPDAWNRVTESILGFAFRVHRELGPGLAEVLYERALEIELSDAGIATCRQHRVTVHYKDHRIGDQVLDLVVEELVVVELKSVESVPDKHLAQLAGYLRASDLPLGLLLNFNTLSLRDGIYRRLNQNSSRFSTPSPPSAHSANSAALRTPPSEHPA